MFSKFESKIYIVTEDTKEINMFFVYCYSISTFQPRASTAQTTDDGARKINTFFVLTAHVTPVATQYPLFEPDTLCAQWTFSIVSVRVRSQTVRALYTPTAVMDFNSLSTL